MRRVYLGTTAAVAAVLITAGCGSESAESDPAAGGSASAPQYQVINEDSYLGGGSADLLIANATTDQARIAIRNYAETLNAEVRDFTIRVVLTPDAKTYVCTGHWLRDAEAAKRTASVVTADTWPYLEIDCSGGE